MDCRAPAIFIGLFIISGCSVILHERKPDRKDPADQGSKTEFRIDVPDAKISHIF